MLNNLQIFTHYLVLNVIDGIKLIIPYHINSLIVIIVVIYIAAEQSTREHQILFSLELSSLLLYKRSLSCLLMKSLREGNSAIITRTI